MMDFNDTDDESKNKAKKEEKKKLKRREKSAKFFESLSDEDKATYLATSNALAKQSQAISQALAAQIIDPELIKNLNKNFANQHSAIVANMLKNFPTTPVIPPNVFGSLEGVDLARFFPTSDITKQIAKLMKDISPDGIYPLKPVKPEDFDNVIPSYQHNPMIIDPTIFVPQGLAEDDKEHIVTILRAVQKGGMTVEEANALLLRIFDK